MQNLGGRQCIYEGFENSQLEKGSSVPLSCFATQPSPLERKKNEKTWARCCILDYFFLFIPEKNKTIFCFCAGS